jgi:DNA-binding NarL/FixJ family response regulator
VTATARASHPPVLPRLNGREQQVLSLVACGATNRHIAATLYLAEGTVKYHLRSLFNKFGVESRAALVHEAARGGYLT